MCIRDRPCTVTGVAPGRQPDLQNSYESRSGEVFFIYTHKGEELQCLQKAIVKNLFSDFSDPNVCIFKQNSIF